MELYQRTFYFYFQSVPMKHSSDFKGVELCGIVCGLLICNTNPRPSRLLYLCLKVPRAINVLPRGFSVETLCSKTSSLILLPSDNVFLCFY